MPRTKNIVLPERIILGIDPGTNIMGFGVIRSTGKNPEYVDMGILDIRKEGDHYMKLKAIFKTTIKLIENYSPNEMAVEAPFYGKNVQSMLKLGRAQGVALAAALSMDLPVFEYAPRKIKLAITGAGQASKEQVSKMLERMFSIPDMPKNFDASDGLAAAVCHFYENTSLTTKSSTKNWGDFIRKNPGRVK
jgi:crossover junction endodeoxyribonuclease RuvC